MVVQFARHARRNAGLVFAGVLLLWPPVSVRAQGLPTGCPPDRVHVYLLIGQSNMAGRGDVAPEDTTIHPRVFALGRDGQWKPASEPIHFDKPVAGVGPGLAFGKAVAERDTSVIVALAPAAVGGTSIHLWQPGQKDPVTGALPYDDALRRARRALRDGVLKGILWNQGESDSNERAEGYEERLLVLIRRLRSDLAAPNAPFVVGKLPPFTTSRLPRAGDINHIFDRLPDLVPCTAVVETDGLGHRGDGVHYDSASARELGRRYAAALTALRSGTCHTE